jgi:hypothetical protein
MASFDTLNQWASLKIHFLQKDRRRFGAVFNFFSRLPGQMNFLETPQ